MLDQSGLITGCRPQVKQKIANVTGRAKKRVRRSSNKSGVGRGVDRMTEENRGLREAQVAKGRVGFSYSQIKLISNDECQKKLKGIYKVHPSHLCGYKPGSLSFSLVVFL